MAVQSVNKGLKLELKSLSPSYKTNEIPSFNVVITNVSNDGILFCRYMLEHRLLCTLMGEGYEVFYFGSTKVEPLKNSDFVTLTPGQSITVPLKISEAQNYELLYAGHLPPSIDQAMGITGLPAGNYTFQVFLGSHVKFYNAPEKTHNYHHERKNILKEVPKSGLEVDVNKAWQGEIQAECTFKTV